MTQTCVHQGSDVEFIAVNGYTPEQVEAAIQEAGKAITAHAGTASLAA